MILSFIAGVAVASFLHFVLTKTPVPRDVGPSTEPLGSYNPITHIPHFGEPPYQILDCSSKYRTIDVRDDGPTPGVKFPGETVFLKYSDGRVEGPVTFRAQHRGFAPHWDHSCNHPDCWCGEIGAFNAHI